MYKTIRFVRVKNSRKMDVFKTELSRIVSLFSCVNRTCETNLSAAIYLNLK